MARRTCLIASSCAVLLYCLLIQRLIGQLNVDERYFAHVVWLLDAGYRQYQDFYSNHLPVYFHVATWLVKADDSLTFVYWLRTFSAVVIPIYAVMVIKGTPEDRTCGVALLIAFLLFGRMVEVRPDTFGLLLMNAAWFALARQRSGKSYLLGTLLGFSSLLFSARAAVALFGFGLTVTFMLRREPVQLAKVGFAAAVCLLIVLAVLSLFYPVAEIIKFVFLEPLGLMPKVPLYVRLFNFPDRFILCVLVALSLAVGRRDAVIAGACLTQIAMIAFDPSPFTYVYGWSAIPVIIGICRYSSPLVRMIAAVSPAAVLTFMSSAYFIVKRHDAPPGSSLRLTLERPIGDLSRQSTPALVSLMVASDQQALWNQLLVRSAVCRRVQGSVLSVFASNPICLPDAHYGWIEINWDRDFAERFDRCPPSLFIWRGQFGVQNAVRANLTNFFVYPGFALRRRPSQTFLCH